MTDTPVKARRFTPQRIVAFLLIIAGVVLWEGQKKIPSGPAEGSLLEGPGIDYRPTGPTLRVATFNIAGGAFGLDHVAHAATGFDLVGFQEVHGHDQSEFLSQHLRRPFVYAPVESQWWIKSFGNAAMTALDIRDWQRIPISSNDSDSNRNVILLRGVFAEKPINVLITHIDRQQDHASEIRAVANLFLSLQEPAILMGDFNLTEDANGHDNDPDIAALVSTPGVIDPIGKAYDRIFARGFVALNSGYVEEHASDHPLAWAELRLPE